MAGHCGGGIVQHHKGHICLIVNRIYHTGDGCCKEGRVSHEGEAGGVRLNVSHALSNAKASPHAEAGVHHVKGHGVAHGVAADISAENCFSTLHCPFYRIEGGTMGTTGAKHWRTDWQRRHFFFLLKGEHATAFRDYSKEFCNIFPYAVRGIFTRIFHLMGELALYSYRKLVFPGNVHQLTLDDRVQLLDTEDFIQPSEESHRQFLWEREGGGHLQLTNLTQFLHCLGYVGVAEAAGGYALLGMGCSHRRRD